MGNIKPKAFLSLGGIPLLIRTLQKFEACRQVNEVSVIVPPEEAAWADKVVGQHGLKKVSRIIPGGSERQDSVYIGLEAIEGNADWVVIHDGVRPFVPVDLIDRLLEETRQWKAVVAGIPPGETLKEISSAGEVVRTLDRDHFWIIQTPQCFESHLILQAHRKAREEGFYGTDDAALVERLGVPVKVVVGSRFNIKMTTPEDLVLGEALLQQLK